MGLKSAVNTTFVPTFTYIGRVWVDWFVFIRFQIAQVCSNAIVVVENPAEIKPCEGYERGHIRYREYFLRTLLTDDILIEVLNELNISAEH